MAKNVWGWFAVRLYEIAFRYQAIYATVKMKEQSANGVKKRKIALEVAFGWMVDDLNLF